MSWLRILHRLGLTNLSDEQVALYESIRKAHPTEGERRRSDLLAESQMSEEALDLILSCFYVKVEVSPDFTEKVLKKASQLTYRESEVYDSSRRRIVS